MNNRPDNPAQVYDSGEMENETREIQTETLIEFARDYFAAGFPNPDRHGCPDRAKLTTLAQAGHLPDDELRAHLFGCSDCFREYRTALATRAVDAPAAAWWQTWRDKLVATLMLRPGLVWTSVAALLLAGALLIGTRWRGESHNPLSPAASETAQAHAPISAPAASSPTPDARSARNVEPPAPQSNPAARRGALATEMVTAVSVDLNEYVALRGVTDVGGGGQQFIRLAPVRTRLKLRLPEGSLAGAYTVSLVDEFDKALATDKAVSRDAKWLIATLDFRHNTAKSYRLKVEQQGAPPDFYPAIFSGAKQAAQKH